MQQCWEKKNKTYGVPSTLPGCYKSCNHGVPHAVNCFFHNRFNVVNSMSSGFKRIYCWFEWIMCLSAGKEKCNLQLPNLQSSDQNQAKPLTLNINITAPFLYKMVISVTELLKRDSLYCQLCYSTDKLKNNKLLILHHLRVL